MGKGFGKLIVIDPGRPDQSFLLTKPRTVIGSAETNDLVVNWAGVSGKHSSIECSVAGCYVVDLGSDKGTFVNNRRVKKANLAFGDIIKLGSGFLRFEPAMSVSDSDVTIPDEAVVDAVSGDTGLEVSTNEPQPIIQTSDLSLQRIGRYEIEQVIGPRGPYIVYLARDPQLERPVAIKLLSAQFATEVEHRTRVRREVELIAALEHPNIVQVYDFGDYQGHPFVVMPFLSGGTLAARLSTGPLTLAQLAPIIERVAAALDAAHLQGIIHCQLNPDNILFDAQGRAYLSDFGLSATSELSALLTGREISRDMAKYVSPEQARAWQEGAAAELSGHSDIYALGIILFEALTGQAPYQAETAYETAMARLSGPIPRLHGVKPDLPEAYQTLIDQALAPNPADRYPTATKLADHVKEIVSGRWYLNYISDDLTIEPAEPSSTPDPQFNAASPAPPSSDLKIGRYRIERQLGRGGMAIVHLAHDPTINRQVAIKVMFHRWMENPQFRDRFHHEAKLVASLKHNAIVAVYDYGQHHEQPFIVMQYLPGGTLANQLAGGPLKLRVIAPIIEHIAAALDAAHARNIIHQDVKPANIIFNADNQAFLSDFGIAWMFEAGSGLSGGPYLAGTPAYMSPEQAQAIIDKAPKKLDGRSDIYSLGIVFFQAVSGQLPYRTGKPRDVILAHLTEPVPRLPDIEPRLPAACQEIIDRALAKDPADRYQTAQELARDVKELAAGRWFWNKISE